MTHDDHRSGTKEDCAACAREAYEPGWYATLLRIDDVGGSTLTLDAELARERGEAPVT